MTLLRMLLRWPLVVLYLLAPPATRAAVDADAQRFSDVYGWRVPPGVPALVRACGHRTPEFRTILYYRMDHSSLPLKVAAHLVRRLYPGQCTLFVRAGEIGPGLFIQHGFATTIGAARIGANCWINQQVTIGHVYDRGAPTIGDDVTISAGAVVVGGIHIGDGSRIGANTTVVKDLPAGSVVVGAGMRFLSTGTKGES